MLVVESVVPGGPADGVLEPGDVLVTLEGAAVVHFQPLEALLDNKVGSRVAVEVERGGRLIRTHVQVAPPIPAVHALGCAVHVTIVIRRLDSARLCCAQLDIMPQTMDAQWHDSSKVDSGVSRRDLVWY